MKRIHQFGACFGIVCALTFTLMPFVAGADSGPRKPAAVTPVKEEATVVRTDVKRELKRINRRSAAKDFGCSE